MTFLGAIRDWRLQGKTLPQTLEGQGRQEEVVVEIRLSGTEHWSHTQEHLTSNSDKLLEAECGLACRWETPGGCHLRETLHFQRFDLHSEE